MLFATMVKSAHVTLNMYVHCLVKMEAPDFFSYKHHKMTR